MPNELGALIEAEVGRAESDLSNLRTRGQSVLTASGALVTLLAAVIAIAVGKDTTLRFSGPTRLAAMVALIALVVATLFVLLMYLPAGVDAPASKELASHAKDSWNEPTWEQDVAIVLATYLIGLRSANARMANLLRAAVAAEVVGIAAVSVMALSLLGQVK